MEKNKQGSSSPQGNRNDQLQGNDFTSADMGTTTTLEDQLGGKESTQALRDKVEKGEDDQSPEINLNTEDIESTLYPTSPPAAVNGNNVEGNKNSYNKP